MIKVLIIDDSSTVRMLLSHGLSKDPEIKVVGTASDPYVARDMIAKLNPDVLTLDVEMPRMDGLEFLQRIMATCPMPVIMVSALTQKGKEVTLQALECGAVDFVTKPSGSYGGHGLSEMINLLATKIKLAAKAKVKLIPKDLKTLSSKYLPGKTQKETIQVLQETSDKVIVIGASTGGTQALHQILAELPGDTPGIVIVQHITAGFTKLFAERLNDVSRMTVKEAESGDRILTGRVLIAPSNSHTIVKRSGATYVIELINTPPVDGLRPSIDVLFHSVAQNVGKNAIGVILTGMGGDGAKGLLAMRQAGAKTIGQDEPTCIVYGMPKVAWELGAVEKQVPLQSIASEIIATLKKL